MCDSDIFRCFQTDKLSLVKYHRECLILSFLLKTVGPEKVVRN